MTSPARFSSDAGAIARAAPPAARLLLAGAALIFLAFMRYGIGELGWVVHAPLLVVLYRRPTRARHLAVLATLVVAYLAAVSKMVTPEIPWAPVPLFAVPIALSVFACMALAAFAHRRLGPRWGAYSFASMTVAMGWIQYTFTPGSSWGLLAHTQMDNLPLLQLAAVAGLGGIGFLVALGSSLAAAGWSSGWQPVRVDLAVFSLLLAAALLYGQLRLWIPSPGPAVRVGSVVSPVTHEQFREAYGSVDTLRRFDDELFARSARAADFGARVVVWNEVATLVTQAGEVSLAARGQAFARERRVMLVMAYAVVESVHPFRDRNKYRVYLPDGTLADDYTKRHPVPGDPDEAGTAHARVVSFAGALFSGGICYDYGFPGIARDNARDGAGVSLVPSSDWRGIDPGHGRMALMNAVAAGVSLVRPVRAATSIAADPYGRLLGSLRSDAGTGGVLVADVPCGRVPTLYARTGEVLPRAALAFCLMVLALGLRARQNR